MSEQTDAPDTAHSQHITDHPFMPPEGLPWGRCQYYYSFLGEKQGHVCGMSEAAHAATREAVAALDDDPGRPESMRRIYEEKALNVEAVAHQFTSEEDAGELNINKVTAGKQKVDGERQEQHGDPVPNMIRFATMLNGYFGARLLDDITAHDAAMIQILFKICRSGANPAHLDNYDDVEGYAEIARRCAGV